MLSGSQYTAAEEEHAMVKSFRALCVHGWRVSAKVMQYQTSHMRAALQRKGITSPEFVIIDAPFPAKGATSKDVISFFGEGPYYEWYNREEKDDGSVVYEGIEQSLPFLQRYVRDHGPFDAIIGFSQGAAMSTLLLGSMLNDFSGNLSEMIKMAILVCGMVPSRKVKLTQELFPDETQNSTLKVPSIHILGRKDQILHYSEQLCQLYADESRSVLYHEQGHQFGTAKEFNDELAQTIIDKLTHIKSRSKF